MYDLICLTFMSIHSLKSLYRSWDYRHHFTVQLLSFLQEEVMKVKSLDKKTSKKCLLDIRSENDYFSVCLIVIFMVKQIYGVTSNWIR